jgi:hypothetical protein
MTVTITLPNLESVPSKYRGRPYRLKRLLLPGDSNTKLRKGESEAYRSFGLSLAPAKESGYNVCPSSTAQCRATCLHFQGHSFFPSVKAARIARTIALKEKWEWFRETLLGELDVIEAYGRKEGVVPLVRLNVFSDIPWEVVLPQAFEREVLYYDYTKLFKRMLKFCRGEFPRNYHLTFSRSESNESECEEVLKAGGTVAVVFRGGLPKSFFGVKVVPGDERDWRFLDPPGVVVGLTAKGTARYAQEGFVVEPGRIPLAMA